MVLFRHSYYTLSRIIIVTPEQRSPRPHTHISTQRPTYSANPSRLAVLHASTRFSAVAMYNIKFPYICLAKIPHRRPARPTQDVTRPERALSTFVDHISIRSHYLLTLTIFKMDLGLEKVHVPVTGACTLRPEANFLICSYTGASGGIGLATIFLSESHPFSLLWHLCVGVGACVTAHYNTKAAPLAPLMDEFGAERVRAAQADLTREDDVEWLFADAAASPFGPVQVRSTLPPGPLPAPADQMPARGETGRWW